MADAMPRIKFLGNGATAPGAKDPREDLPGYKPKPKLEKAPYVKDRSGMIWHWQPWMKDMGDVLEACWTAPPKAKIQVPSSALDIEHYGKRLPQRGEPAEPRQRRATGKRKKGKRKPPMPYSKRQQQPVGDGDPSATAG